MNYQKPKNQMCLHSFAYMSVIFRLLRLGDVSLKRANYTEQNTSHKFPKHLGFNIEKLVFLKNCVFLHHFFVKLELQGAL